MTIPLIMDAKLILVVISATIAEAAACPPLLATRSQGFILQQVAYQYMHSRYICTSYMRAYILTHVCICIWSHVKCTAADAKLYDLSWSDIIAM